MTVAGFTVLGGTVVAIGDESYVLAELDYTCVREYGIEAFLEEFNRVLVQLSDKTKPLTEEQFLTLLDKKDTHVYVLMQGETICAFLARVEVFLPSGVKSWIDDVTTDTPFRKRGLATWLLDWAERERPLESKHNNLTTTDKGAEAVYRRAGWVLRQTTNVFRKTRS